MYKFVVNNFNDLLGRTDSFHDEHAEGFFFYRVRKIFYDFKVDIGFKKRQTHFTHSILDVFFRKLRTSAKGTEHAGKSVS